MPLRRANLRDVYEMQEANLRCLPENYHMKYFLYHYISWPQLLYVDEDYNGKITGYVLAKMEEDDKEKHGHITSVAVLRSHRKLGLATQLMNATEYDMEHLLEGEYLSLHVRRTNEAALHLYQRTLGFRVFGVEEKYYADDEDAFDMRHYFGRPTRGATVGPNGKLVYPKKEEGGGGGQGAAAAAGASSAGPTEGAAAAGSGGGKGAADGSSGGSGGKKKKKGKK